MTRQFPAFGYYSGRREPAVLFYGNEAGGFLDCKALTGQLASPQNRLDVVLCSPEKTVRDVLAAQFDGCRVIAPPLGLSVFSSLMLSRLKVRVVVCLAGNLPGGLAKALKSRGTPVLRRDDIAGDDGAQKIMRMAGRERAWEERRNRPLGRMMANWLYGRLSQNGGRAGGIIRFETLQALAERLGRPQTIMCLGNGPSSEDERLPAMAHDALFRANHVWMTRNILTSPDMVFTGMQASMRKLRGPVFGVLGDTTQKVLLMVRAAAFLTGGLEYCVIGGENGIIRPKSAEDFRPTSGAVMLAVAVALKPAKLIIAGMDMFRHPDGAYPGDETTPNAYTATHSHNSELAFILDQLDRFEGELVIVSDVLRAEWERHKAA